MVPCRVHYQDLKLRLSVIPLQAGSRTEEPGARLRGIESRTRKAKVDKALELDTGAHEHSVSEVDLTGCVVVFHRATEDETGLYKDAPIFPQ